MQSTARGLLQVQADQCLLSEQLLKDGLLRRRACDVRGRKVLLAFVGLAALLIQVLGHYGMDKEHVSALFLANEAIRPMHRVGHFKQSAFRTAVVATNSVHKVHKCFGSRGSPLGIGPGHGGLSHERPREGVAARDTTRVEVSEAAPIVGERVDVTYVLDRIYETVFGGVNPPEELSSVDTVSQKGSRAIGAYRVRTTDGAFAGAEIELFDAEGAPSNHVYYGYDGAGRAWIWEEQTSKQRVDMDLDEKEATIMNFWAQNALYALPSMRRRILIDTLQPAAAAQLGLDMREGEVCLTMSLRRRQTTAADGLVTAYQFVDTSTWLPTRIQSISCNGLRTMAMSAWRTSQAVPSMIFPSIYDSVEVDRREIRSTVQSVRPYPWNGTQASIRGRPFNRAILDQQVKEAIPAEAPAAVRAESPDESKWENPYAGPRSGYDDVIFDPDVDNMLELQVNPAGQLLIPATINGQDIGFWMLDTGASTNTMADWAVDLLGLAKFGDSNSMVVGGHTKINFVEVESFAAGPMSIMDSVFAVMDLRSMQAKDGPKVAGVLGYEFFSRVVVEIQNDSGGDRRAFLYDPLAVITQTFLSEESLSGDTGAPAAYSPLRFVAKTPHVEATIQVDCELDGPSSNLMLIDTGAGGSDVVFNTMKAFSAGVTDQNSSLIVPSAVGMVGVGGVNMIKTHEVPVKHVDVGAVRLDRRGMTARLVDADVDHSSVANGVLGMRIFQDCRFVIDYPNKRIGVARGANYAKPRLGMASYNPPNQAHPLQRLVSRFSMPAFEIGAYAVVIIFLTILAKTP